MKHAIPDFSQYNSKRKHRKERSLKPASVWAILSTITLVLILCRYAIVTRELDQKHRWLVRMVSNQAHASASTLPPLAPIAEQDKVKYLFRQIWGKDADIGIRIGLCESGLRANASHINRNGTVDEGIMQVNSVHKMPDMLNATANISYAYVLYKAQGTAPWLSSSQCWG